MHKEKGLPSTTYKIQSENSLRPKKQKQILRTVVFTGLLLNGGDTIANQEAQTLFESTAAATPLGSHDIIHSFEETFHLSPAIEPPTTTIFEALPTTTTTSEPPTTTTFSQPEAPPARLSQKAAPKPKPAPKRTTPATAKPKETAEQKQSGCPAFWVELKPNGSICYSEHHEGNFITYVARFNLSDSRVTPHAALTGKTGQLNSVRQAAAREGAVVAINGQFFANGQLLGPMASDGAWKNQNTFAGRDLILYKDGTVKIKSSQETLSDDVTTMQIAIQGSHALVTDGVVNPNFGQDRLCMLYCDLPRTVVGVDDRGKFLYFFVVKGGRTLPEIAREVASYGANWAVNLDGGPSSQMVKNGQTVNDAELKLNKVSAIVYVTFNPNAQPTPTTTTIEIPTTIADPETTTTPPATDPPGGLALGA